MECDVIGCNDESLYHSESLNLCKWCLESYFAENQEQLLESLYQEKGGDDNEEIYSSE